MTMEHLINQVSDGLIQSRLSFDELEITPDSVEVHFRLGRSTSRLVFYLSKGGPRVGSLPGLSLDVIHQSPQTIETYMSMLRVIQYVLF